jgi:hypothetical protein
VKNLLSSRLPSKNVNIIKYKFLIFLVVLYGCETWSLILSEEHKMREFEKMVLRRRFEPKRDEVSGGRRKLQN